MSVLPAEIHAALTQLLQGLQSPDNVQRTAAEKELNDEWVSKRPEILLMGLTEQIQGQEDANVSTDTSQRSTHKHLLTMNSLTDPLVRRHPLPKDSLEGAEGPPRSLERSLLDPSTA